MPVPEYRRSFSREEFSYPSRSMATTSSRPSYLSGSSYTSKLTSTLPPRPSYDLRKHETSTYGSSPSSRFTSLSSRSNNYTPSYVRSSISPVRSSSIAPSSLRTRTSFDSSTTPNISERIRNLELGSTGDRDRDKDNSLSSRYSRSSRDSSIKPTSTYGSSSLTRERNGSYKEREPTVHTIPITYSSRITPSTSGGESGGPSLRSRSSSSGSPAFQPRPGGRSSRLSSIEVNPASDKTLSNGYYDNEASGNTRDFVEGVSVSCNDSGIEVTSNGICTSSSPSSSSSSSKNSSSSNLCVNGNKAPDGGGGGTGTTKGGEDPGTEDESKSPSVSQVIAMLDKDNNGNSIDPPPLPPSLHHNPRKSSSKSPSPPKFPISSKSDSGPDTNANLTSNNYSTSSYSAAHFNNNNNNTSCAASSKVKPPPLVNNIKATTGMSPSVSPPRVIYHKINLEKEHHETKESSPAPPPTKTLKPIIKAKSKSKSPEPYTTSVTVTLPKIVKNRTNASLASMATEATIKLPVPVKRAPAPQSKPIPNGNGEISSSDEVEDSNKRLTPPKSDAITQVTTITQPLAQKSPSPKPEDKAPSPSPAPSPRQNSPTAVEKPTPKIPTPPPIPTSSFETANGRSSSTGNDESPQSSRLTTNESRYENKSPSLSRSSESSSDNDSDNGYISPRIGGISRIGRDIEKNGLTGLRNIGNTCFMNSVLQCLSNTKPLLDYILKDDLSSEINYSSSMKGALVKSFANVIQELWRDSRVVDTSNFKDKVQQYAPRFMGYSQQDAQEFLRYLLEGLHEEVNRVTSNARRIHVDIDDSLMDTQKAAEAWKNYIRYDDSFIVDLFVGQLKSTLKCTVCGHCSVTFDPFWDISLPIPSKSGQTRLYQCLDLFTREEILDGDEKPTCSKCQKRQKCTKSFLIQKFPKILVIHLKRFSPMERYRGKLSTVVEFPLTGLDLGPYTANRGQGVSYNLYGISNHSGSAYSGHYIASCKHPETGEWHCYNDSRVSSISKHSIVSSEAYVLFYELAGQSSKL